jgi:phosphoribosylformylglycinamidine (FGAM) synthase PurS component
MNKKIGIKIMPRDVLLDTQGRTVASHLQAEGMKVSDCRIGKFIEIEFNDSVVSPSEIEKILKNGLYNPLIEKFEIMES